MSRRLVAALACRANSSRLYAKPLQPLAPGVTILSQLVAALQTFPFVEKIVLGIAEGDENLVFREVADTLGVAHVFGPEEDVLGRVIACAHEGDATDVFRKTTEDPFFDHASLEHAWAIHVANGNDITALDGGPEGLGCELFTLEALERSHRLHETVEQLEHVPGYALAHPDGFRLELIRPEPALRRPDLRLTVDNPEDLVVARAVYETLADRAPLIPLDAIVDLLDRRPDLTALNARFASGRTAWPSAD